MSSETSKVKFEFTELEDHGFKTLTDKEKSQLILEKWGLSGLKVRTFSFTGKLPTVFDPIDFFLQFFKTRGTTYDGVESIEIEPLTTNTVGNTFWKKLWECDPPLVRNVDGHPIQKCMDRHVRDLWISDCLQTAILDEDSDEYFAFNDIDRKELIFHLMKALVIGGVYCQFEDSWDVYQPVITSLYKDIVGQSVVKNNSGAITIIARAFELKKINDTRIGTDPDHSWCYLVVDVIGKKVRLISFNSSV